MFILNGDTLCMLQISLLQKKNTTYFTQNV